MRTINNNNSFIRNFIFLCVLFFSTLSFADYESEAYGVTSGNPYSDCQGAEQKAERSCDVDLKDIGNRLDELKKERPANLDQSDGAQAKLRSANGEWLGLIAELNTQKLKCKRDAYRCKSSCKRAQWKIRSEANSIEPQFRSALMAQADESAARISICETLQEKGDLAIGEKLKAAGTGILALGQIAAGLGIPWCKIAGGCNDGSGDLEDLFAENNNDPCSGLQGQVLLSCQGALASAGGVDPFKVSSGLGRGQTTFNGGGRNDFGNDVAGGEGDVNAFGEGGTGAASAASSGSFGGGGVGVGGGSGPGGGSGLDSGGDFASSEGEGGLLSSSDKGFFGCLLYTSPSPRDRQKSRMPSSA